MDVDLTSLLEVDTIIDKVVKHAIEDSGSSNLVLAMTFDHLPKKKKKFKKIDYLVPMKTSNQCKARSLWKLKQNVHLQELVSLRRWRI